jgi:protein SCO1/2
MSRGLLLTTALLVCVSGCHKPGASPHAGTPAASANTNRQTYQAKGVVIGVKPEDSSVTIRHETVPGYMPAMTMPFAVKDTNELAGLAPGDPVSFRIIATATDGWIDQIHVTGPKTNILPTTGPFRVVRDVEPLAVGDILPDYHFTNQLGQAFSTADFKGQPLAIEFLFTRCPFPNFCPLMANNFEAAQTRLLAMTNAPAQWHLLTISFDPEYDSPAVLKTYAESHHYDPRHWIFATGELIDVTAIGEQLGFSFGRDPGGGFNHNLRAAVFDASGRLQRIFVGNQWTADELVNEMLKTATAQ